MKYVCSILLLISWSALASADTIRLRSHESVNGEHTTYKDEVFSLSAQFEDKSMTLTFNRDEVESVEMNGNKFNRSSSSNWFRFSVFARQISEQQTLGAEGSDQARKEQAETAGSVASTTSQQGQSPVLSITSGTTSASPARQTLPVDRVKFKNHTEKEGSVTQLDLTELILTSEGPPQKFARSEVQKIIIGH